MNSDPITPFIAGCLLGVAVTAFTHGWCEAEPAPDPRIEMQDEFDAYRHCMQSAGKMRCSMTPQDFVRYYEIKRILEQTDDDNPESQ